MTSTAATVRTMSSSYRPRPRPAEQTATPEMSIPTPTTTAPGVLAPAMTIPGMSSSYRPRALRVVAPTTPVEASAVDKSYRAPRTQSVREQEHKAYAAKIIKMFAALPAPLPEFLPPIYVTTPVYSTKKTYFADFVRGDDSKKRSRSEEDDLIGLGLDIDGGKRQKSASGSGSGSPEHSTGRSRGEAKDKWSRPQWDQLQVHIAKRAILAKRYADAAGRTPPARAVFMVKVPADQLRSYLHFTDSMMLFLYSYWVAEQAAGGSRMGDYVTSDRLREDILHSWEREGRREDATEAEKGRAKGMIGLMHLVEAMVAQHVLLCQHDNLQRRRGELSNMHSSTPRSAVAPVPLIIGRSPNSTSPPDPHKPSPSNVSSDALPMDVFNLIGDMGRLSTKAIDHLQTSRWYLSPKLMREHFPRMFENTVCSDMSDEALPAPGDMLGSGKTIDPDHLDHFAWPIELGMSAGIAHLAVFGRGMVKEYAEGAGYKWDSWYQ